MIKIIIVLLILTGFEISCQTKYYSYKLEFKDIKNKVSIKSQRFDEWFCPLVLDSISSSKELEKPKLINQHACIKLSHNYIIDTIYYEIINFEILLINEKYYNLESKYIHHFENVLPEYYFDSIK